MICIHIYVYIYIYVYICSFFTCDITCTMCVHIYIYTCFSMLDTYTYIYTYTIYLYIHTIWHIYIDRVHGICINGTPGPRKDLRLHLRSGLGLDGALRAGRSRILLGGLERVLLIHILGVIILSDFHMFHRDIHICIYIYIDIALYS